MAHFVIVCGSIAATEVSRVEKNMTQNVTGICITLVAGIKGERSC